MVFGTLLVAVAVRRVTIDPEERVNQMIGYSLLAGLFAAMLIVSLTSSGERARKVLHSSALRFFGRYSYGLYVFHHPLLSCFRRVGSG